MLFDFVAFRSSRLFKMSEEPTRFTSFPLISAANTSTELRESTQDTGIIEVVAKPDHGARTNPILERLAAIPLVLRFNKVQPLIAKSESKMFNLFQTKQEIPRECMHD